MGKSSTTTLVVSIVGGLLAGYAAYVIYTKFWKKEHLRGMSGGRAGGGPMGRMSGMGRGGPRPGSMSPRLGIRSGGAWSSSYHRGPRRGWWRWRNRGTNNTYWPWWWEWWYDPFYYVDDSSLDDAETDPCDCFGKYKESMDAGVKKEDSQKVLKQCIEKSITTGRC